MRSAARANNGKFGTDLVKEGIPGQSLPRATLWMMGAVISLIAMALAGRELAAEISIFEIMFFRNLICLGIIVVLLSRSGRHLFATQRLPLHGKHNRPHDPDELDFLQ